MSGYGPGHKALPAVKGAAPVWNGVFGYFRSYSGAGTVLGARIGNDKMLARLTIADIEAGNGLKVPPRHE